MDLYDFRSGQPVIDQIHEGCADAGRWRGATERLIAALVQLQGVDSGKRIPAQLLRYSPPRLMLVGLCGTTIELWVDSRDHEPDPFANWHWRLEIRRPEWRTMQEVRTESAESVASEIVRWLRLPPKK